MKDGRCWSQQEGAASSYNSSFLKIGSDGCYTPHGMRIVDPPFFGHELSLDPIDSRSRRRVDLFGRGDISRKVVFVLHFIGLNGLPTPTIVTAAIVLWAAVNVDFD